MKKIISIILFFILLFINTINVFAHPLDITVSTASIKWKNIHFTTYFHSFEIEYLLKNNWIYPETIWTYYENSNLIIEYIQNNIILLNNNSKCDLHSIEIKEEDAHLILTDWLWVNYSFNCDENINNIDLSLKYFLEFPLQTNRITFYNLNNWIKNTKPILYKVLTNKIYELKFDIYNIDDSKAIDSDWDWLNDKEEVIYATDINNIDTDWDNYTDREEIDSWWDPLNWDLWPAQEYRDELNIENIRVNISHSEEITSNVSAKNLSDYWYGNSYLKNVMKYIDNFFTHNQWNLLYIFLIVFWLWVIHAIWPWHSKSLLVAYTLERDHWYKKWILFAFIFTLTHIIDILILFIITKVIISFIDVSKFNYYIQVVSAILLFFLSLYLLYKAYIKKQRQHLNKKPEKTTIFIAFLAWLAPCSFAWSIFLLLLAVWKSTWILPLVLALWLWIFTTLVAIVILAVYLKNKIYSKAENIWIYSSFISAIIIFTISVIMISRIL